MSNEIVSQKVTLPASLDLANDLMSALTDLSQNFRPVIKISGRDFKLDVQDNPIFLPKKLNCIIMGTSLTKGAKPSKKFYFKKFDGGSEAGAPDCHSFDGLKPDEDCLTSICTRCDICPKNAWGSDTSSQNGAKACKDYVRLALYFPTTVEDVGVEELNIYRLDIPSASLKTLGEYAKLLARANTSLLHVITEISFDLKVEYPKLTFKLNRQATQEDVASVFDAQSQEVASEILTYKSYAQKDIKDDTDLTACDAIVAASNKNQISKEALKDFVVDDDERKKSKTDKPNPPSVSDFLNKM